MVKLAATLLALSLAAFATPKPKPQLYQAFNGEQCYRYTAKVVGFGPRTPGSIGHKETEALVRRVVERDGGQFSAYDFIDPNSPRGTVPVHNLIAKFNVSNNPNQPIFILAGHYDTLFKKGFVGAVDGGSSTAILLSFADALHAAKPTKMQIWLVWTDFEEAVKSFQGDDGLVGSRHLAHKLAAAGLVPRIRGFFLLDMIGYKDLSVDKESSSTPWLQAFIMSAATKLGYQQYFFKYSEEIIDDQKPFANVGIPVVDVVDAHFGPMPGDGMGAYHHTNQDTMDKVSSHSLTVVGKTVLLAVELIDAQ
ncbi:MAG: M28 family peptidase [Acidobacteria bacterium]|nr:MAG: M28 family peptidase [Acidobacteriota bacterium]